MTIYFLPDGGEAYSTEFYVGAAVRRRRISNTF